MFKLRSRLTSCLIKLGDIIRSFPIIRRWYIVPRDRYDLLPAGCYDYIPKGLFVFGPASHFLLVPKNRYRLTLLPGMKVSGDKGVGWITEENTPYSYDLLWGEDDNLDLFRKEGGHIRDLLTEEIVDELNGKLPPLGSIVDVGCGVGDLLAEILSRYPSVKVNGLDFSARAIEKARDRFQSDEFIHYIIEKDLPYDANLFDLVLCTDVLEHLEYPGLIVAELLRICRPGGLVVIVVPDGDVDQFFGHNWFWNEASLSEFLAPWHPLVSRLPKTKELMARMQPSSTNS